MSWSVPFVLASDPAHSSMRLVCADSSLPKRDADALERLVESDAGELASAIREWVSECTPNSETQIELQVHEIQADLINDYGTLEFEEELGRLFSKSQVLVVKSPFVRQKAFRNRRVHIEAALDRGAVLVLVASISDQPGSKTVDDDVRGILSHLETKYPSFVFAEIPSFHEKVLYAATPELVEYSGSFNVLSFSVDGRARRVRQERMTCLPWRESTDRRATSDLEQVSRCLRHRVETLNDQAEDKSLSEQRRKAIPGEINRLMSKIHLVEHMAKQGLQIAVSTELSASHNDDKETDHVGQE